MSTQIPKREEANTPEVGSLSLPVETPFDFPSALTHQKQKKAVRQAQQREVTPLAPEEIAHREGFWEFVNAHGAEWHRQHLGRLLELWREWNQRYFAAALVPPYILLNEPVAPNAYGSCARISGFGARSQIRIRPSLLKGTHPRVRPGKSYAEGRFLFAADIALHEMIHQWQQEVTGKDENGYHGHGPAFRDKANEIGAQLGLPRVRTSKNRGKDKGLPSCSQWPHNVRPAEYYQGAYRRPAGVCSTQALCAAASRYAEKLTHENLLELGRVAVAYHNTALKAKQAKLALSGDEEDDMA
jgi:hypothetical protein